MSSWESLVRMGVVHFMAYPQTKNGVEGVSETVGKIARDDFFQAIEISWIKDEEELKATQRLLAGSGLDVAFAAQLPLIAEGLDLNALDPAERRRAVDFTKGWMDQAVSLGASGFAVLSGIHPGKDKEREAVDALVESLKELCQAGGEKGLNLVLESFEHDVKRQLRLVGPTRRAAEVSERVREDCDNFGILVDLSHLPLLEESPSQAIADAGPHLVHAHIGSCVKDDESHPCFGDTHPPFFMEGGANGVEEVVAYLKALWDSGFFKRNERPLLSFEVSPRKGDDPDVVLAGAKRVFREAWSRAFG